MSIEFYKKGNPIEKESFANSLRCLFTQCQNEFNDNIELINREIYCEKCKRLLVNYSTPIDNRKDKVLINAYWYVYLGKTKKISCQKCNTMFDTDKLETNLFECKNCGGVITDSRPLERFYNQGLLGYAIRQDNNLGLQCSCGTDTREGTCNTEKAIINSDNCPFKIKEENGISK